MYTAGCHTVSWDAAIAVDVELSTTAAAAAFETCDARVHGGADAGAHAREAERACELALEVFLGEADLAREKPFGGVGDLDRGYLFGASVDVVVG